MLAQLINYQEQIRIFHWQTKSFAEHKALGKLYESLSDLIDQFVEVYFGKYGRRNEPLEFSLENYEEGMSVRIIDEAIGFLTNEVPITLQAQDTDLLNIRDEMLSSLNRTKYLLTLK